MDRHKTLESYRAIDLSLFALILIVFETLIVNASNVWFPGEAWSVSAVAAVTAIVLIRWGPWGGIHAFLGGIVFVLVSRGTAKQVCIYALGNLLCLAVLPLIRRLFDEVNPIPVKAALAMLGRIEDTLRLPLCPLDGEKREQLRRELKRMELVL